MQILFVAQMTFGLIPISWLTEADIERRRAHFWKRNLYNKYSEDQLADWMKVDLYEALDLDAYRDCDIPVEIIKNAVRDKSAKYHPSRNMGKQHAFLVIQRAQSVLSEPKYRRVYDSNFLDESLPEDREYGDEEFFQVFSDAFDRNGLFSEIKPVPHLNEDVEVFYRFWQGFKTVRIYDNPEDVFGVDGATRRYQADKNREIALQKRQKDLLRIQELVRLAIKRDPRIKKKPVETSKWNDEQLKSLARFNTVLGKMPNKFDTIAKKLNDLYLTKRTANEIKMKVEQISKKTH